MTTATLTVLVAKIVVRGNETVDCFCGVSTLLHGNTEAVDAVKPTQASSRNCQEV